MTTKLALLLCLLSTACALPGHALSPTITQTVGTGASESFFVINFNDNPNFANNPASNYVFGYKYDGAQTGEDLITALKNNVPAFTVTEKTYSFDDGMGNIITGSFVVSFTYQGHTQTGAGNNYWSYFESDASRLTTNSMDWDSAGTGALDRALFDQSYDGWTFATPQNSIGFNAPTPITPGIPAPEPNGACVILVAAGSLAYLYGRRRLA